MYNNIIIVTGLPRSGTSMAMQVLEAGGVPPVTDSKRKADQENLYGYYEDERVKHLKHDNSWVSGCYGMAIKVVSYHLPYLPLSEHYKIVFMQRNLDSVIASQNKMLRAYGKKPQVPDDLIKKQSREHVEESFRYLNKYPQLKFCCLGFGMALKNPELFCQVVKEFLSIPMDTRKMMEQIDPSVSKS